MGDEAAPDPTEGSGQKTGELEIDVSTQHPGFATTAFGPGDVRDTPRTGRATRGTDLDAWIGRTLANVYRVEAKIGEGGMGSVYAARHIHIGKQVAVKVLAAQVASNATAVERLKQEAIAASSIDHDNIVEVISFDRYADGAVFIVMEFLRGESLAERMGRGPLPLHEALAIAHQVASALGAAHARDIVHRDLKPENVFLAKKGEVERAKVLDFGISKVKSSDAEQVRMTRTGQLVGTPLYMSPEQARGETEIDRRVDVYALGVMMYEMLTGVPPFDGRNYFELLWKHGNETPEPLRRRNPNVHIPEEVEAVVLRALEKRPDDRFASMEELAAALRLAAPDVPLPSTSLTSLPPARPSVPDRSTGSGSQTGAVGARTLHDRAPVRWPRWAPAAALAGVVGLAALGAVAGGWGGAPSAPAAAPPVPSPPAGAGPAPQPGPAPPAAEPAVAVAGPDPASVVEVALDSTPAGAEVSLDGRSLGATPCFADLPAGGAPVTLLFHRDGFVDETQELVPAEGARVTVRLRPRRRGPGPGSGTLPMKTEL